MQPPGRSASLLARHCRRARGAFVRDLSDEARYYRFMTRLSDLPEAMAERLTINENIGHPALVDEVFADANATRFGEARYIVDRACRVRHWAAPDLAHVAAKSCRAFQRLSHARRHHCSEQGDHLARQAQGLAACNPKARPACAPPQGLADRQSVHKRPRTPFGDASQPPEHEGKHLSATRGKPLWPVGHRTPVSIPHPAWL